MSPQVNPDVLPATSRILAALKVIPRVIGPKEVWATWMRDGLTTELVCPFSSKIQTPL